MGREAKGGEGARAHAAPKKRPRNWQIKYRVSYRAPMNGRNARGAQIRGGGGCGGCGDDIECKNDNAERERERERERNGNYFFVE